VYAISLKSVNYDLN